MQKKTTFFGKLLSEDTFVQRGQLTENFELETLNFEEKHFIHAVFGFCLLSELQMVEQSRDLSVR